MTKSSGMENAPSKKEGQPSGKGRSNKPPKNEVGNSKSGKGVKKK